MTNLIIDLGNTKQKAAIVSEGKIITRCSTTTLTANTIEDLVGINHIDRCLLSSVTTIPQALQLFLQQHYPFKIWNKEDGLSIKNRYQSPTLGSDRLAAVVGGSFLYPNQNVLVVQFGTCLTFDFINANNEYLGGSIAPGIAMRFKALHSFTNQLPELYSIVPCNLIGNTTESSILSGVLNGIIAETKGIIAQYSSQYPSLVVIFSGGDALYFENNIKINTFAVHKIEDIVMVGLDVIANKLF